MILMHISRDFFNNSNSNGVIFLMHGKALVPLHMQEDSPQKHLHAEESTSGTTSPAQNCNIIKVMKSDIVWILITHLQDVV